MNMPRSKKTSRQLPDAVERWTSSRAADRPCLSATATKADVDGSSPFSFSVAGSLHAKCRATKFHKPAEDL